MVRYVAVAALLCLSRSAGLEAASGTPTLWSLLRKDVLNSQEVNFTPSRPSAATYFCVCLDRVGVPRTDKREAEARRARKRPFECRSG